MSILRQMGLNVVSEFNAVDYPTDGLVFRLKDTKEFEALGHTAKHPRGAFALKEAAGGCANNLS